MLMGLFLLTFPETYAHHCAYGKEMYRPSAWVLRCSFDLERQCEKPQAMERAQGQISTLFLYRSSAYFIYVLPGNQGQTNSHYIMKRRIFTVAMAAISLLAAKAQNNELLTATLQHGEQTKVFIGVDAFKNAYEAAANSGDVITLSSGLFNAPSNITKSLSVYGTGFEDDEATGTKATVIGGSIILRHGDINDSDGNVIKEGRKVNGCRFEGIALNYISLESETNDIIISKCKFGTLSGKVITTNLTVKQCVGLDITGGYNYSVVFNNLYIVNSHLDKVSYIDHRSTIQVDHCIITGGMYGVAVLCTNSILYHSPNSGDATAKNNIFVNTTIDKNVQNMNNNWTNVADAGVWAEENADGSYAEDKTFELKYPEKYVGTDGTQIGLHGGLYPWNKIPGTPRIVESNIDTKTSAEGKLKVSIKVEAQTKE